MIRTRIVLIALATTATIALAGCGAAQAPADSAAEASALRAVGFETGLEAAEPAAAEPAAAEPAAAEPAASEAAPADKGDRAERRIKARKFLRKNTLHGEVTVQGKEGPRTIVVQRGSVTATDGKTITVKSTDGFELTWTAGDKLRVRKDKKKADVSAIKQGAEVGIAGAKDGTTTTARLVVVG